MSRHTSCRAGLVLAVIAFAFGGVKAQSVVYDWTSDAKVPESYPTIRRRQSVTFRIRNVNKILYSYRLEITQTPIASDDFSHIAGLLSKFRAGHTVTGTLTECQEAREDAETSTNQAIAAINGDPSLPPGYAASKSRVSVSLKQSLAAWYNHQAARDKAIADIANYRAQCAVEIQSSPRLNQLFSDFEDTVRRLTDAVLRAITDPDFVDHHDLEPGKDTTVTVIELFGSEVIKTKTFSFPGTDVLTLSAGSLFSRIPDRTYEARKAPGSDLNLLTVEGNSRATPALAALLNYSLGSIGLDSDNAGLALSAGPVLKLGNQSESSSFGFFAGLSGHLYNRFYVTPGIHFGQFADFPVGFSNGSTVPANFGQLDPVKRWTARFGLAITFKAKDFSGLTGSDKPSVTGDEAQGSGTPAPAPSPSPSPTPDTNATLNLSNAPPSVARDFLRPARRVPEASALSEPTVVTRERVAPREDLNRSIERPEISTSDSRRLVSSTSALPITSVTSIMNARASAEGERIVFEAGNPIRDWVVAFRNGRFFLTIPRAHLEVMQDGLSGRSYTDASFERHGDDLVISFTLLPGTKARVLDTATGLTVDFLSGDAH